MLAPQLKVHLLFFMDQVSHYFQDFYAGPRIFTFIEPIIPHVILISSLYVLTHLSLRTTVSSQATIAILILYISKPRPREVK